MNKLSIKNTIKLGERVDLSDFDTSGFDHPIEGLRLLQEALKGNKNISIFKCTCGKFFLFPTSELTKVSKRIVDENLLCNACAPKGTRISFKVTPTEQKEEEEVKELVTQLFTDSNNNNRFTFCYYLWSVLPKFRKVDLMLDTVSSFQSVIGRISAENLGRKMGIKIPEALGRFHKKTDIVLMLMVYCHLHEITDLLDILFVLVMIATSEYRSVIKDDRGSPALKLPPEGLVKQDVYEKLNIIIKLCKQGGYKDLARLLSNLYKPYIRNAVYHSQYEFLKDSIVFRYKQNYDDAEYTEKTLSISTFSSLYSKMMTLHLVLLEGLVSEREQLIKEGSVKENGMTLTPIVKDGGFSVKIQWS